MPDHECRLCHEIGTKRCTGCQKAWYCSAECQKYDWVRHIFECNPSRPITTADHLALAVVRNLLPEDQQTCIDYGFHNAFTAERMSKLLGLYVGLLDPDRLGVKPQALHKWRLNGTLIEEIKNAFERLPIHSRGGYYSWFLENQHLLQNTERGDQEMLDEADAMFNRSWVFIGGSPTATREEKIKHRDSLSKDQQSCFNFYTLLLSQLHPAPFIDAWIKFGFCGCSREEEMDLSSLYTRLIRACTFDEFCAAYSSSSLASLFHAKNFLITSPYILDVLSGSPHANKSVWDLKQYIIRADDDNSRIIPPVAVDYGFVNCTNAEEKLKLKDVYKGFFALRDADPLKLHEACIGGRLLEYISEDLHLQLKPKKLYKRLLKNSYPLAEI